MKANDRDTYLKVTFVISAVIIIIFIFGIVQSRRHDHSLENKKTLIINRENPNYGIFLDNIDSEYYLTSDQNVKNILETLVESGEQAGKRPAPSDFALNTIYYYDNHIFIIGEKTDPRVSRPVTYSIHSISDLSTIGNCFIITDAGFYSDENVMISGALKNTGGIIINGACVYERGSSNFRFIDLSRHLSQTETIFRDPAGQLLNATIQDIDTKAKIFTIFIYNTENLSAPDRFSYKRSVIVSY